MGAEANIRDVANRAGVSTGTVSRVLRGAKDVRPDNASRVRDAVRELAYAARGRPPLGSGRAPHRRKTNNLGFYLPKASPQWANHPMFAKVYHGLDRACSESGFHYLTEFAQPDGAPPRMVTEHKIDGLLVKGSNTPWLAELCTRLPVVGINQNQPGLPFDQINCDDYHSGYSATEHLWRHGHRRIAFLSSNSHHPMLLMRYQGYERFLRGAQHFDPALIHLPDTPHVLPSVPETAYPNFDAVLGAWQSLPAERRPTAVLTANDWNAAGLYQSARRLGLPIPDAISVLSFDNAIELCTLLVPTLSSYEVAVEEATYLAARRLIEKIDNGPHDTQPITQSLAGRLVERDSVRSLVPAPATHQPAW